MSWYWTRVAKVMPRGPVPSRGVLGTLFDSPLAKFKVDRK